MPRGGAGAGSVLSPWASSLPLGPQFPHVLNEGIAEHDLHDWVLRGGLDAALGGRVQPHLQVQGHSLALSAGPFTAAGSGTWDWAVGARPAAETSWVPRILVSCSAGPGWAVAS